MASLPFDELLPIGSVVLLKNAQKRLMVFGIGQTDTETGRDYDYIGVMYPEGNMGDGSQFFFNHTDIGTVEFRGYEEEERKTFIRTLQSVYDAAR